MNWHDGPQPGVLALDRLKQSDRGVQPRFGGNLGHQKHEVSGGDRGLQGAYRRAVDMLSKANKLCVLCGKTFSLFMRLRRSGSRFYPRFSRDVFWIETHKIIMTGRDPVGRAALVQLNGLVTG